MSAHRIELPPGSVNQDLVARAVAAIKASQLVVLPTETVYGIAARPTDETAKTAIDVLKGRLEDRPFTHHIASVDTLKRLAEKVDWRLENLTERYWPGPLTVIVRGADGVTFGVRLPAHAFTQTVIGALGGDLLLTSVNRSGEAPLVNPESIETEFGAQLELIFDGGRLPLGPASTIVRCTEAEFEVVREGVLTAAEIFETAARLTLFVCTGNTCRSPLAEGLARLRVAEQLGCAPGALLARGLQFASAGVATGGGSPASQGSLLVGKEVGVDLSQHESQPLTMELANRAHHIYCSSWSHRESILYQAPHLVSKVSLLDPSGDIFDPFGGSMETYQRALESIESGIEQRLPDIVATLQ